MEKKNVLIKSVQMQVCERSARIPPLWIWGQHANELGPSCCVVRATLTEKKHRMEIPHVKNMGKKPRENLEQ